MQSQVGFDQIAQLPLPALIGIALIIVVQIVLDVIAFVDLYKRPADQLAFGNKVLWVIIILFVNTIGAIIYLAAGRKPAQATEVRPAAPAAARAANAADALYGSSRDADRR